jgi:arylsulfatase
VHWPKGIDDKGGVRHQFHHVTDIAPTIFEIVGATRPDTVNGHAQMPSHGTSLAYSFPREASSEPTRKRVQYFEMFGHRGIWANGWKAVTHHEPDTPFDNDVWELYHLDRDFSECHDVAKEHPAKLKELIDMWWVEAGRNGVLPLDDRRAELWRATTSWGDPRNKQRYVYRPPVDEIRMSTAPSLNNRTYTITADIERQSADTQGCLVSFGDGRSGFALYVLRDRLVFDYNLFGQHLKAISSQALPAGKVKVGVFMERLGRVARASVLIDGKPCGSVDIPFLVRRHSGGNLNIGRDEGIAVSDDYVAPFEFQGRLHEVVIDLPVRSEKEAKRAAAAEVEVDLARQ